MSSHLLPAQVQQAATLLRDPQVWNDPQRRQTVIDWGLEEIALEYQPSPFRPGDLFRRMQAEAEWRRVVREAGKQLRAGAMQIRTQGRLYTLQRQLDELIHQDLERRRRASTGFDTDERIREARGVADAQADAQIKVIRAQAAITALGGPPTQDPLEIAQRVSRKIDEIRADPALSEDDKHRQTEFWREALPHLMQQAGRQRG